MSDDIRDRVSRLEDHLLAFDKQAEAARQHCVDLVHCVGVVGEVGARRIDVACDLVAARLELRAKRVLR